MSLVKIIMICCSRFPFCVLLYLSLKRVIKVQWVGQQLVLLQHKPLATSRQLHKCSTINFPTTWKPNNNALEGLRLQVSDCRAHIFSEKNEISLFATLTPLQLQRSLSNLQCFFHILFCSALIQTLSSEAHKLIQVMKNNIMFTICAISKIHYLLISCLPA